MRSAVNVKYHRRIEDYDLRAFRSERRLRCQAPGALRCGVSWQSPPVARHGSPVAVAKSRPLVAIDVRTSPPSFECRLFSKYRNDFIAGRRPDRSLIEDLMEQPP